MNYKIILKIILSLAFIFGDPYKQLDIDFLKNKKTKPTLKQKKKKSKKADNKLPEYQSIIENFQKIEGLFTFYWNKEENKVLLSISPNQFEVIYLANFTRQSGDGYYYDSGSMLYEFPFIFKKQSDGVQFVHVNTLFRADDDKAISKAIQENLSNSLIAKADIVSQPDSETGAILIDGKNFFIRDIGYINQQGKGRYTFDKKNSYIVDVKSFLYNSEIEISTHYKSNKWTNSYTLPNSRSMEVKYHVGFSALPDNDFTPRPADDRVGYFSTIYQDYSDMYKDTPYIRYINKWNLKKKNPGAHLSEPIEPIVYWIENTVPEEFRGAIREGVLAWNHAFEKIGFKNAIIVKQMPDDADWDPADVRYSTIRWIVQPGSGYAVGPSRANPYTGELYDADIRISSDFARSFFREFDEFVNPVTTEDFSKLWKQFDDESAHKCMYSHKLKDKMSIGWHSMIANNFIDGTKKELHDYVYQGLVDLVLHEVGHTLGLRHNFKASSIFTTDQLSDKNFTAKHGISGSVMDYHPVNLFDKGNTVFQTKPGPYDIWAIEYGYSDFQNYDVKNKLSHIAEKSNLPFLVYGTDEDAFGRSSKGVDPLCSVWDLSSDPIAYYKHQIKLVNQLWDNLIYDFKVDGNRYQKIRSVFSQGIGEYVHAGISAPKFIGGMNFRRNHIGDPDEQLPFKILPAQKQREALNFMKDFIFHPEAFEFSPELLNMLAPERHEDFNDYAWNLSRIDYPIHSVVKRIQGFSLFALFDPRRLARIQDNELKTDEMNPFTQDELFSEITSCIWIELKENKNINSFKRQLQQIHIMLLSDILYNNYSFTNDSIALARFSLESILENIYLTLSNQELDHYTLAHLTNSAEMIDAVLNAQIKIN